MREVFLANRPWDVRPALGRLACPTLLLRADPARGGMIADADLAAVRRHAPHTRIRDLAGTDHDAHRSRFAAFMAEVGTYLEPGPGR